VRREAVEAEEGKEEEAVTLISVTLRLESRIF
jgi:hypothetical protein